MGIPRNAALAAAIVIVLAVAFSAGYIASISPAPPACSVAHPCGPSASSQAGAATFTSTNEENQTVVAAYVSTLTTTNTETTATTTTQAAGTTTTTTSTTSAQLPPQGGSFTYTPTSQVKVLSVSAEASQGQSGPESLTFAVQFENTGSGPIYVLEGGGSGLTVASLSGPAVTNQSLEFRCVMPAAMAAVNPGENHTSSAPGCWSEYTYLLEQPGTIQVQLVLSWLTGNSPGAQAESIQITAEFALS